MRWTECLRAMVLMLLVPIGILPAQTTIRATAHDAHTRIVLETRGTTPYRIGNFSRDQRLLVLELPAEAGPLAITDLPTGSVTSVQQQSSGDGRIRVSLKTSAEVMIEDFRLENPTRVVLDLHHSLTAPRPQNASNNSPAAAASGKRTRKPIVVIDPGHGGSHKGGIGKVNGRTVYEKEVTLAVSKEVERLFKADRRFEVYMTRRDDRFVSLTERVRLAQQFKGDVFVSIHTNAVESAAAQKRAKGLEFWTWNREGSRSAAGKALEKLENAESGNLGQARTLLNQMMLDALESEALRSRGLARSMETAFLREGYFRSNYRGIDSARFKVLENFSMPSVLIELGFLTHPEESKVLADPRFQKVMAQRIYEGLALYLESAEF